MSYKSKAITQSLLIEVSSSLLKHSRLRDESFNIPKKSIFERMRKAQLLCLLTTFWLISAASMNGGINCNIKADYAKNKATSSNISTSFSSSNAEIELTWIQLFAPIHKIVEKKEPGHFPHSTGRTTINLFNTLIFSSELLAVISFNCFKLLFPFHHFW